MYDDRTLPAPGGMVVGVTSNTAPWEILRAAGLRPFLLSPRKMKAPLPDRYMPDRYMPDRYMPDRYMPDRYMEDVFSARIKAIFDFLISPQAARLSAVVIPRTSEQEHKLFLYLREVARQGAERTPQPILYNLLHARSPEAEAYGLERTHDLKLQVERLIGRRIESEALLDAIAEGNTARQAIRELLREREGAAPRLRGAEALMLIGAWYFMDRSEYAALARRALLEIQMRPPLQGPRILIRGSSLDGPDLCAAVEAHGAIVVAEDDWWGSRAAGRDIDTSMDPVRAIFEKYYFDAPSPRVFPSDFADAWFHRKATEVDGVILYLSPEDDVAGWDYPRLRSFLEDRAIPHLMLRDEPESGIGAFVERLRQA